ncbi:MAG: hypothetical protein MI919_12755 [Holophagales bacterium]|nr:hypothetical protein [Holophagales bacterium]
MQSAAVLEVEFPEIPEVDREEEEQEEATPPLIELGEIREAVRQTLANIPEERRRHIERNFEGLSIEGWAQIQELAYQLVLDGRFQNKIVESLDDFASYHELALPPQFLEWATQRDDQELLETMRDLAMGRIQYISASCPARADFGISAGIIIGADIVISIAVVALDYQEASGVVTDLSEAAESKL